MTTTTDSTGSELTGIAGWAVDVMDSMGGPGTGLAIALENLFPPLPSEVILPLAGFTASQGKFGLAEVLIWNSVFVLTGYSLGENWTQVQGYAEVLQRLVILVVVIAAVVFVVRRVRQGRRGRHVRIEG